MNQRPRITVYAQQNREIIVGRLSNRTIRESNLPKPCSRLTMLHHRNDANDGPGFASMAGFMDLLTDRILPWEELIRKSFIYDRHSFFAKPILVIEFSSAKQRNSHRFEIAGRDKLFFG